MLFDSAARGSASVAPSPPPSRLVPDQACTGNARAANIGASTLFTSVSPVFASCPPYGIPRSTAHSRTAAGLIEVDGVKSTYAAPASNAASAPSELAGSTSRSRNAVRSSAGPATCTSYGASVDATLIATT
jgi:hypothetical protein